MARFMCALVIYDAVRQEILPAMGDDAPEIVWEPTAALMKRIEAGETADGLFAIDGPMDGLVARGALDASTRRPVVQAEFGLALASGMDAPALTNAADMKALLLSVPSIVYSRSGASGIYFEKLIDRLAVGDAVRAKSIVIPHGLTAEKVRDGEAVLAIQQMSELRAVEGIETPVPFPDDCQQKTDFSAAVFTDASDRAGALAFIEALTSPAAGKAYADRGLGLRFQSGSGSD